MILSLGQCIHESCLQKASLHFSVIPVKCVFKPIVLAVEEIVHSYNTELINQGCRAHPALSLLTCCINVQEQKPVANDGVDLTTQAVAEAWLGNQAADDQLGGMEVVDEKVLAAASLGQFAEHHKRALATNSATSTLSSTDTSIDLEDSSIDMPEYSGKLKAQKYRKGE